MNLKQLLRRWRRAGPGPELAESPASPMPVAARPGPQAQAAPRQGGGVLADLRRRLQPARPAQAGVEPAFGPVTVADPAAAPAAASLRPQPALRGIWQWLGLAGLLVCMLLACAVGTTAWDLVSAGRGLAQQRPATPELGQFPALARVPLLPQKHQNPDLQRALKPNEDRLLRAVQNIATFENARAEPTLRAAPAVLQAVVAGSVAEQAGLQAGDVLRTVNGKEAGFVWDVYKQATERPVRRLELAVQRGADAQAVVLELPSGEQFDMTNLGLLFAVPSSARFIGHTDTARIAAQLRQAYLEPLPVEEQAAYTEGLLTLSNALVSNLSTLQAAAPGSGAYLRSEELLVWHHRQHQEAQSAHRIGLARLQARQSQALAQLGWCLLACTAAALVALALAMRRTWRP
jgi:hypothetical protein